jgi:predicted branched-subunit amino acid permease
MDLHALPITHPWRDVRDGLRDIAAPAIAAIPIGLLFGAVAAGKGLSVLEVALMSGLVFAGGAQFAGIEIWGYPVPVAALAFSTLLINLRHVLMGASLAPKARFGTGWRLLGFSVMADENWALAERRATHAPVTLAYWGPMGALFWANWVTWSTLGAVIGAAMGPPERFGADFAFTAMFIGLIAGFVRGRPTLLVIAASAAAAALTYQFVGAPWHVAAGALAGIAAAYGLARPEGTP